MPDPFWIRLSDAEWDEFRRDGKRDYIVYQCVLPGLAVGLLLGLVRAMDVEGAGRELLIQRALRVIIGAVVGAGVGWLAGLREWSRREARWRASKDRS